ncbi:MAG: hypothetical protein K6F96_05720 [Bacteroidales bacterium]|nr:hypothetical protein [Bacteroidales bacterium]
MIDIDKLYEFTNGGADLFRTYFPDFDPGNKSNMVRLRDDDTHPSSSIFLHDGKWLIKDHGGSDNQAKNMINFVMEHEAVDFKEAVAIICQRCNISIDGAKAKQPTREGKWSKVAYTPELRVIKRPDGKFTEAELAVLGPRDQNGKPCITQYDCDQLYLVPLDGYIIPTKEGKGKGEYSWKVEATDSFPIMMYDYGEWGRIYTPFGENRFMFYGKKPRGYIFGCRAFREAWEKALNGSFPHQVDFSTKRQKEKDDDGLEEEKDERWEALTICSGGSDALNVHHAGHIVCWPNSESEPLSRDTINKLLKLTRNLYVLYDADATGVRMAYNLALKNLDIQVISLPADLGQYSTGKRDKDGNEKFCKDIKDFCMYYKRGQIDPYKEFKYTLVKLAKPLKFWMETEDKNGNPKIEISNAHLYQFLQANGFHKMPTDRKGLFKFIHVSDNVVEEIPETDMAATCRKFLITFLMEHSEYYSVRLENTIHRSKQISNDSLKNLDEFSPDFNAFTETSEFFFFRNGIFKATKDGIEKVPADKSPFFVLQHKVIPRDFSPVGDLFKVDYSDTYQWALQMRDSFDPDTPEYLDWCRNIDKLTNDNEKYKVCGVSDFDYVQYVWNTGNKYWREEEEARRSGAELTEEEHRSIEKNFLNKVTSIGYLLCKYKVRGSAKAVYCMETNILEEDEGSHKGGTGKSFFIDSLKEVRKREFLNGQNMKDNNWQFIFQRIDYDTDIIHIDDLNSKIDLNRFLPDITGDLVINPKNTSEFVIPFDKAPKFAFTSNHAIKKFDDSLRRRIQFVSFSDYYHSANSEAGLKERSPRTEFGRDLLKQYDSREWNLFYNFMLQCVVAYMRYGLIEPDMPDINARIRKAQIGLDFLDWADDYFDGKFNQVLDDEVCYNAYKAALSRKEESWAKKKTFTKKIIGWCEIRGYSYNPQWFMKNRSDTERKRGKLNLFDTHGEQRYGGFYIQNDAAKENDSNSF